MHQGATKHLENCSFHLEKHCTCDRAPEMLYLLRHPRWVSPPRARKSSGGNTAAAIFTCSDSRDLRRVYALVYVLGLV